MTDPAEFAQAINLAGVAVAELVGVCNALVKYAVDKHKLNTDLQLLPLERESVHRLALPGGTRPCWILCQDVNRSCHDTSR